MSVWPTAAAFRQSAANGSVGVEVDVSIIMNNVNRKTPYVRFLLFSTHRALSRSLC